MTSLAQRLLKRDRIWGEDPQCAARDWVRAAIVVEERSDG